jgi:hypothetical protein
MIRLQYVLNVQLENSALIGQHFAQIVQWGQAESCSFCSPVLYSDNKGGSKCISCPIGKYSDGSGQTYFFTCPHNFTTFQARSFRSLDCICPNGTFGIHQIHACRECPSFRGIKCEANSSAPFVSQGYWRNISNISLVYECIPSFACLESGYVESK